MRMEKRATSTDMSHEAHENINIIYSWAVCLLSKKGFAEACTQYLFLMKDTKRESDNFYFMGGVPSGGATHPPLSQITLAVL